MELRQPLISPKSRGTGNPARTNGNNLDKNNENSKDNLNSQT